MLYYRLSIMLLFILLIFQAQDSAAKNHKLMGKIAPDFSLPVLNEKTDFSLKQAKGKIIVLDFWASWCAPCRKSLPYLEAIGEKFKKDVQIVAISIDDDTQNALDFLANLGLKLMAVHDRDKNVVENYNIPGMPTAFIIDREGVVRFVHGGYTEKNMEDMIKEIKKLI